MANAKIVQDPAPSIKGLVKISSYNHAPAFEIFDALNTPHLSGDYAYCSPIPASRIVESRLVSFSTHQTQLYHTLQYDIIGFGEIFANIR